MGSTTRGKCMQTKVRAFMQTLETELIRFTQELVKIPSITGEEGDVARCIHEKMQSLGYDQAVIDELGNVIGVIGDGPVTGAFLKLHSFLPAWEIGDRHTLTQACVEAYRALNNRSPQMFTWDFCTNGVATAGQLGIPTIGFGPGDPKKAHVDDEFCPVAEIVSAAEFYTLLPMFI